MFWNNNNKAATLKWKCRVTGCDFACDDYFTLQKHTCKKHPGFRLYCEVDGCHFSSREYRALERHMFWKHPEKVI